MRWGIFFGLLLGFVGKSYSQVFEVTEKSDAIRPTLLSFTAADSSLVKVKYFVAQFSLGSVFDYQYRDVFTKENFLFGRAAFNYYFNRMQLNGKILGMHDPKTGQDFYRTRLQLGYSIPDSVDIYRFQLSWNTENRRSPIDPSVPLIHEFVLDFVYTSYLRERTAGDPDVESGYVLSYRPQFDALFYGYSSWIKIFERPHFARHLIVGAGYYRNNIKGIDRSAVFKTQLSMSFQGFTYRAPLCLVGTYSVDYRDHYRKNWELGIILGGDFIRSLTKSISPRDTPGSR